MTTYIRLEYIFFLITIYSRFSKFEVVLFSDTHFIIHRPLKVLMRIREKNISSLISIQRIVLKFRVSRVTVNIYSHISNMQLSSDLHNLHTVCPYTNMTKDRGGSSDLHNLHKHTMCP